MNTVTYEREIDFTANCMTTINSKAENDFTPE